ncbi:hypothetical protein LXA43DRAFT_907695 [Ganoderma leucocontextum]|nr:hypothetical protein LXA43DRAFT_907695 [Ganoderma leucocontextum]
MANNLDNALLYAFRLEYQKFEQTIRSAFENGSDTIVLERLGDRLSEFLHLVHEHASIFDPDEFQTIVINITAMCADIYIDPEFLAWAYTKRSISSIARFLGVHRHTVKRCLIEYGIVAANDPLPEDAPGGSSESAQPPMPSMNEAPISESDDLLPSQPPDDILDPTLPISSSFPNDLHNSISNLPSTVSNPGPQTQYYQVIGLNDDDLDQLLIVLRSHYHRAGVSVLDGMLRALGYHVTRERLRQALVRVDPVRRVFERIRIRRREYKVAGPNALWHHDGQHGGSVHNVRIERLWVDVTAQVGAKWADLFTVLELQHGLNINSSHHIWLLHRLFLDFINFDLTFFTQAWNEHKISMRNLNASSRSPADMYGFDMLIHGVRGDAPAVDTVASNEELEVYGLDWEALQDDTLRASHASNNPMSEGWSSWLGRTGPPEHLNEVNVESPHIDSQYELLLSALSQTLPTLEYASLVTHEQLVNRWVIGLATAVALFGSDFET